MSNSEMVSVPQGLLTDGTQWVPCSPAWLAAGGDCAAAPRICCETGQGISHMHPAHQGEPSFEAAYNEWVEKSQWIRTDSHHSEWHMHPADVIKKRYDQLQADLTERDQRIDQLEQALRASPCVGAGAQILAFMESRGERE